MVATVGIVVGGIEHGIERANKLLMPILAVIVIALAIHSLTLPDARRGLHFLFAPNWVAFFEPRVYLAALGQAFFSLGLAMASMSLTAATFLSIIAYLRRLSSLPLATRCSRLWRQPSFFPPSSASE